MEDTACITKILKERHEEPVTVYNLAVKDWVSYFVGNVRVYVHNGLGYTPGDPINIDGAINNGQPLNKHQIIKDPQNFKAKKQPANSSADLLNPDGSVKRRRYYGADGNAKMDIDFNHTDDGTHEFPHIHIWDWSQKNQDRKAGNRKMHDNDIISYNVNLIKKNISVKTYNNEQKKYKTIYFSEVLTHSFRCIIDYNIISDICESGIQKFIQDNQKELIKLKGFCWPINYNTEQELIDFLITNKYKYIEINSSYGMFGWVIAKSYEIRE